jgi:serine/threonine-protein phosphatase 2B catalytic subunit
MDSFDLLPLACIINKQYLVLHGGISPSLQNVHFVINNKVNDINKINRFQEPPTKGNFCDLLWADPIDDGEGLCEGNY